MIILLLYYGPISNIYFQNYLNITKVSLILLLFRSCNSQWLITMNCIQKLYDNLYDAHSGHMTILPYLCVIFKICINIIII